MSSRGVSRGASVAPPPQGPPAATSGPSNLTDRQQQFIQTLAPDALDVSQRTGIPYQLLMAIPANETGWGQSVAGNNYFGIKGPGKVSQTWEVVNGQRVNTSASFRTYNSPGESMQDFADLVNSSPRYQNVRNYLQQHPNDWRGAARLLQDDGYATDPEWSNKIISLGGQVDVPAASSPLTPSTGVSSVISVGSTAIGSRYQWGGAGGRTNFDPNFVGSDCSGFVAWAYEQATGIRLPAQTSAIYSATQAISPDEAMPGDLVEYNIGSGPENEHVGIYAGNGMMLHDSSLNPNGGVDLTPLWSGAQFRRVPGVDPSLVTKGSQQAPEADPSDPISEWAITNINGQQVWMGTTAGGKLQTQVLGPSVEGAEENSVVDASFLQDQGSGNEMGAGGGPHEEPPLKDDWMYPDEADFDEGTPLKPSFPVAGAPQLDDPKNLVPKLDGGDIYPWTAGVKPPPPRYVSSPSWGDVPGPPDPSTTQSTYRDPWIEEGGDIDPYSPPQMPNFVPQRRQQIPIGSGQEMGAGDDWYTDPLLNTGAEDSGPTYYAGTTDEQGNVTPLPPPSATTVSRAADLGWSGPSATPTAQGQRVAAATVSAPTPPPPEPQAVVPTGNADVDINADVGRFDLGPQPTQTRRALTPPAPAPQTGQGTVRHAIATTPAAQASATSPDATSADVAGGPPSPDTTVQPALPPPPERNLIQRVNDMTGVEAVQKGTQFLAKPETQALIRTADNVVGALANPGQMIPGIAATADWARENGVDITPATQKLLHVDPGSSQDRVVQAARAGKAADPIDLLDTGQDFLLNRYNEFRTDVVRAAQPPNVRGTPEGEAMAKGIALVSDPINLVGMPDLRAGSRLIEDGIAAAGGRSGVGIAPKLEPKLPAVVRGLGPESGAISRDLARPWAQDEAARVFQTASLEFTGDNARLMEEAGKTVGRHEPLSGEQIRRTIVNAVARENPRASPEEIMRMADETLSHAGATSLTTDAITKVGPHGTTLERLGFTDEMGQALDKLQYSDPRAYITRIMEQGERAANLIKAGRQARQAGAMDTAAAARLGMAGLGMAAGGARTSNWVDPNDPNREAKVASGALIGALAGAGLSYLVPWLWGGFDKTVLQSARHFLAPVENLTPEAKEAFRRWAGTYQLGSVMGQQFQDQLWGAFGHRMDPEQWMAMATWYEEHGSLPPRYQNNKAAQAAIQRWQDLTSWAVQHNIIENDINFMKPGSKAKAYVPHAVESEMNNAISLGSDATTLRRGRTASNPFDYYNLPRQWETLSQGMKNGVTYDGDIPRVWGNYASSAIKRLANQQLVEDLMAMGKTRNPSNYSPAGLARAVLEHEDVVQVPQGMKLSNAVDLGSFMPELRGQGYHASRNLETVFKNLFQSESAFDHLHGASNLLEYNRLFKHNVLSGSLFHLTNEMRQAMVVQGFHAEGWKNAWTMFTKMTSPGGARSFWQQHSREANLAIRDGLNLNMAADVLPHGAMTTMVSVLANAATGALAGYASGKNQDERIRNAMIVGGAGALLGLPVIGGKTVHVGPIGVGPEGRSLVETISNAMWSRWIPFMKYTTYEMYKPTYGGRAAAEFANEVFGGQNLMAIGRSRTVQDALKLAMLAPDWQEGWARQAGNAIFDWGPEAHLGKMNRMYWGNALVQSAFMLEGMNMVLGGNWSWQNDPDHTLQVKATRLYDLLGWDHKDPTTGQPYTPYIDILGPYKAMAMPLIQTARAATVSTANALGFSPDQVPFHKEIYGAFGEVPEADWGTAKDAWTSFGSSRVGFLPTAVQQLVSDKDWAGRPIDQADDDGLQRALNRVSQAGSHFLPTGEQQLAQGLDRGDPGAMIAVGALTGMRTSRYSQTNKYYSFQDQYVRDLGESATDWQKKVDDAHAKNAQIDADIESIQNGTTRNEDGSEMTPSQRDKAIMDQQGKRQNTRQLLQDLIDQRTQLSPDERAQYGAQLRWLQDQTVVGGTDAPADLSDRPDLDPQQLMTLAWNRDPDEIALIQGKQPPATDAFGAATQWLNQRLTGPPPGKTATQQLSSLRQRWLQDTANTYNVDPAVMQDMVKQQLYGKPGDVLPALPGVTSAQLDDIVNGYQNSALGADGKPLPNGTDAAQKRHDYLFETAAQLGVDEQALATRIRLRSLPLAEQTDAAKSRSNALNLLTASKAVPFLNPDGTPMGDPKQWAADARKLEAAKDPAHYRSGVFISNGQRDPVLNALKAAQDLGSANRYKEILKSPDKLDYERWFGDGANMTEAQWQAYQNGTLDMWVDKPPPSEAKNRNAVMLLAKALTPTQRVQWSQTGPKYTVDTTDRTGTPRHLTNVTLLGYLRIINANKSKAWTDIGPNLDDVPVDPSNPSGVG